MRELVRSGRERAPDVPTLWPAASLHAVLAGVGALAGVCGLLAAPVSWPLALGLGVAGLVAQAPWMGAVFRRHRVARRWTALVRKRGSTGVVLPRARDAEAIDPGTSIHDRAPIRVRLDDGRELALHGEVAVDRDQRLIVAGTRVRVHLEETDAAGYRDSQRRVVEGRALLVVDGE